MLPLSPMGGFFLLPVVCIHPIEFEGIQLLTLTTASHLVDGIMHYAK